MKELWPLEENKYKMVKWADIAYIIRNADITYIFLY